MIKKPLHEIFATVFLLNTFNSINVPVSLYFVADDNTLPLRTQLWCVITYSKNVVHRISSIKVPVYVFD